MNLDKIVNDLFENIPYSKKYDKIRRKISESLKLEYSKISDKKNEIEKYGIIMSKYGTLEKAGLLAGYTKEEIEKWGTDELITEVHTVKKGFKKLNLNLYY